jgi:hypothetical protein
MRSRVKMPIAVGLVGLLVLISMARAERDVVAAQSHKSVFITRLYTGQDGQTHAEEVETTFIAATPSDIGRLMKVTGAELHRTPAGTVIDWHPAPRRQYAITLSGRGEIELAGGKKISLEPGHIELAEDTTGKGHITRTVGSEDRVTIQFPLADQQGR